MFSAPSTTTSERRQLGGRGFQFLQRLKNLYKPINIRNFSNPTKTVKTAPTAVVDPPIANGRLPAIGSPMIRFRAASNDPTIGSGTPKNPLTKKLPRKFVDRELGKRLVKTASLQLLQEYARRACAAQAGSEGSAANRPLLRSRERRSTIRCTNR